MSITGQTIIIGRDIAATLIPSGHMIDLKAGTPVRVTQALGGNHSVEVFGNLVMISQENHDALGVELDDKLFQHLEDESLTLEEKVIAQIKTCYDPEIPVNVYDLGLIYGITAMDASVRIAMTLTSPTCGMGPFIVEDIKRRVHLIPKVQEVNIELVFDPPWDRSRMSQIAKLQLNLL